jgi:hypothetical protein
MYVSVLIIPQVDRVRINMDSKISFKSLQNSFNMLDKDRISVSALSVMCGHGFFLSNSRQMTVILSSFYSQLLVMFNGLQKQCYVMAIKTHERNCHKKDLLTQKG